VGEGAFGKVILGKHKQTGDIVAIKLISKQQIQDLGKIKSVFREKDLLFELRHKLIIKLIGVSQDADHLYFVFEACQNGDFADLLNNYGKFDMPIVKIYAAQMVQALAFLQSKDVMHRDLKPQNMLLDDKMNLKFVSLRKLTVRRLTLVTQKRSLTCRSTRKKRKPRRRTHSSKGLKHKCSPTCR